ncbi:MAG: Mur ligase family protein [Armatimonadota bacterium]|nr:Mur ligase family protein [Armatimonadota bacterium]MDR5703179.1 Mur ligase family protein [Armatimonadota bacterium]MDR7434769.1 Mur ligase family protein [Armatimonadota bacterium]
MSLRLTTAITLGRLAALASRSLGLGGGTTIPGRVARAVEPQLVRLLAQRLPFGTVVVTGTNGKTTTSRILAHIAELAALVPIHNRAGANLASGVATALLEHANYLGDLAGDLAILEIDEATLPKVFDALMPRVIVLTNLFRDQLDRYGELEVVAEGWRKALNQLPSDATVVLNVDDPLVAEVGRGVKGQRMTFGIEDERVALTVLEHAADARYCYHCGRPYQYTVVYFGHMGKYCCEGCGTRRLNPDVTAREIVLRGIEGSQFTIDGPRGSMRVRTALPGLYNVYNILAACAAAYSLGIAPETMERAIESFTPAFGRGERLQLNDRELVFLLVKNPAGFNAVLRTLLQGEQAPVVLIAINDLIADGRDISWLWDVDFEMLCGRVKGLVVTGRRAEEMALRLKYAGVEPGRIVVEKDGKRAVLRAVAMAEEGEKVFLLPTYTAMLQLRAILQRMGVVSGFWRQ